jgi:hypothetical protein
MMKIIKAIKLFLLFQILIASLLLISQDVYVNFNVAFTTSFLVITASMYAHYKSVQKNLQSQNINYSKADDLVDRIDDPYDLYSESVEIDIEEADFKQIIKEEKAKISTFNTTALKKGSGGGFSFYRLGAYAILILGFMSLVNNHHLHVMSYLIGLGFGIACAMFIVKKSEK